MTERCIRTTGSALNGQRLTAALIFASPSAHLPSFTTRSMLFTRIGDAARLRIEVALPKTTLGTSLILPRPSWICLRSLGPELHA